MENIIQFWHHEEYDPFVVFFKLWAYKFMIYNCDLPGVSWSQNPLFRHCCIYKSSCAKFLVIIGLAEIILWMLPAKERRRYIAMLSPIVWVHVHKMISALYTFMHPQDMKTEFGFVRWHLRATNIEVT